ncbi:MAG: Hsp20/alpha crystallin family protein [Lentisphaeria bacterium]|jgi:HSP20 family molecular chaperone IbpA|nr:Hsp20/alpha crystallin family protein [Lentisphaeria bacterium]
MNLLAKREHEVPATLEKVFPGVDELVRTMFGRMIEPGSGLLRSSVFDSRWETEVGEKDVTVKISCPGCSSSDFELEITGDFLNFKLHHSQEKKEKCASKHYVFRERSCAEYEECIKLPVPVKGVDAAACYCDGVVTVTIPRDLQEPVHPKTIKIKCEK